MANSLVEVNTDTALDLSNEIEKMNTRFNSFVNALESKDRQIHLSVLELNKKEIDTQYKDLIESRELEKKAISEVQQQTKPQVEQPAPPPPEQKIDLGTSLITSLMAGSPAVLTQIFGPEEGLPPTGQNGRMKPEQLIVVGQVSSSPTGGPYWYGNTAYLRKNDAGPAFLRAKEDAAREGVSFVINSAYRSIEHQKALQGLYDVVAVPGFSPHGDGIALDIQTNTPGWRWLEKNGPKYGWKWMRIPNDEVHFEYVGGGTSTVQSKVKERGQLTSNLPQNNQNPIIALQQQASTPPIQYTNTTPQTALNNRAGIPLQHILFATV